MTNDLTGRLQQTLDEYVANGEECGCQLTVFRHGKLVCELFSGWTTPEKTRKVDAETLFPVFSVGKGIVTTLVHILAERGLIDYDAPVTCYWPEYGAGGKEKTRVYELLSHRAGLFDFPADFPFYDRFVWEKTVKLMESMAPMDTIGGMHHYHAQTYGILAGHLAERAAGRDIRSLLQEEIFGKLGITTLHFGMPEACRENLALIDGSRFPNSHNVQFNDQRVLGGCNPSSNGTANATALAKVYASLLPDGLDGVTLLKGAVIDRATQLCRCPEDRDLSTWDKFGLGYALCGPAGNIGRMFGHGGACGSEGFADRETGYAVGFTKNRINATHPVHPLRNAVSRILEIPERIW